MKFKIRISHYDFTLTELLVAMGISGIVMASTYSVYHSPQNHTLPSAGFNYAPYTTLFFVLTMGSTSG